MKKLRKKNTQELKNELISSLYKQFNLRIQYINGKMKQTHLMNKIRRKIARIKMLLNLKIGNNNE